MSDELRHEVGTASEHDIRNHLLACDRRFVPPLSERVEITEYARKLATRSLTIEAWCGGTLVGLVAAYVAVESGCCYVSNVSVLPGYTGRGIASRLLTNLAANPACGDASTIVLEVSKHSVEALRLYARFGFRVTEERGDQVLMRYARNLENAQVATGPQT